MLLLDILIGTLIVFPALASGLALKVGAIAIPDVGDLSLPLLALALVLAGVPRARRMAWTRASVARLALAVAAAAGVLAVMVGVMLAWQRWALDQPEFEISTALWRLRHDTGAAVIVMLVALALSRWSHEPWERSLFVRLGIWPARAWHEAVSRAPERPLWAAAAAVGLALFAVAMVRHSAFESHGHDLGIFTNAMWNLTHGGGYVSSVKDGINLFADHQSPTFWLLAPLFALVPRPETLLAAQSFGLAAGGPALYYLAVPRFGREHWASAALPWLYWLYLPLRNANAFDFHPEVFMLPLFLWAFAAFESQRRARWLLGVLALVAALGAKESAGVVAAGIGFAWALAGSASSGRHRWAGIALALAGVVVFFFDVKVVPGLFGGTYPYMNLYERFGGGLGSLLLAPLTRPAYFFSQLIDPMRLAFLFWTLAPLALLPLFAWRHALAAVPPYLMLFLSEGDQRVRIVFHYGIEPGTALFWALPAGLAAFSARYGWRRTGAWMLAWAVGAHGATELTRAGGFVRFDHVARLKQLTGCLDAQAPIAASGSLVPHLATRAWISYPDRIYQLPSGAPVQCVVTDLAVENWPIGRAATARIAAALPRLGYSEAWRCKDLVVHELPGSPCLRCRPACP